MIRQICKVKPEDVATKKFMFIASGTGIAPFTAIGGSVYGAVKAPRAEDVQAAEAAIDQAVPPAVVTDDFDGDARPSGPVADVGADEVVAGQLDAVVVPGGWAPDKLRRDPAILELVRDLDARGKVMGFICHAGWVAASAGICKGKRVTGTTGLKDDMENAGAIWVDEPAFREENLVWGRVVADIPDFCRELVNALT